MRKSYRALAAYAIWLASICTFVEWSGLGEWSLTPGLAWLSVVMGIAVAVAFDRWAVRAMPAMPRPLPSAPPPSSRLTVPVWLVAGLALAAYALLWIPAWHRPDFSWDGMTYHLPTIHFWAQKGYVHWIPTPPGAGELWQLHTDGLLNGYPKTGELVGFVLARLTDGKLVTGANLVFLPLGVLGIHALARELGASRAPAILAALLFVLVPTNVGQAASTYVDTAYCSSVIAFLAFFFALLRSALLGASARLPLPLAAAAGAALGLALGVKAPALGLAGLAVFAIAIALFVRLRRRSMRLRKRALVSAAASLALMGGIALAIGGFWYFRNAVAMHNPMYPFEIKLAGRVIFDGQPFDVVVPEWPNTLEVMRPWGTARKVLFTWMQSGRLEWPIDGIVEFDENGFPLAIDEYQNPSWPRSIRYTDARAGGLGFLWVLGGLPSLVVLAVLAVQRARRSTSRERLVAMRNVVTLGLFVGTGAVLFKLTPMCWWARYTLWLHAAGLSALAVSIHATSSGIGRRKPLAYVTGAMLVALSGLAFFEYAYALKWGHTTPYFAGPARIDRRSSPRDVWTALSTTKDKGLGAIYVDLENNELARSALSSDEIVALTPLSTGNQPVLGQLSMPVGRKNWIMMNFEVGNDPELAEQFVQKYLPRYVIWDHEGAGGPPEVFMRTATRQGWLRSMMIFQFGPELRPPKPILPK